MDMVRRAIETDSVVFGETVCIAPPCARHAAETLSRWIGQLRENRAVAEVGANTGEAGKSLSGLEVHDVSCPPGTGMSDFQYKLGNIYTGDACAGTPSTL